MWKFSNISKVTILAIITFGFSYCGPSEKESQDFALIFNEKNIDSIFSKTEHFHNKYETSDYNDKLDSILYLNATKKNTIKDWELYKKIFYYKSNLADLKIDTIEERQLFDSIVVENRLSLLNKYKRIYPNGEFIAKIKKMESDLNAIEDEKWKNEKYAFKKVQDSTSVNICYKYLEIHPKGVHKKAVIEKLVSLATGDDYGSLPEMERRFESNAPYSTVSVSNSTSNTLRIMYSGRSIDMLVLAAGNSGSVRLKNGSYNIVASVDDANVRRFSGSETLGGGEYNVDYYIRTSTSRY
jgi:hypothetical protein